jgi:hypothetical protein
MVGIVGIGSAMIGDDRSTVDYQQQQQLRGMCQSS